MYFADFVFDCKIRRSGDYNHPNKPCSQVYASCAAGSLFVRECQAGLRFDVLSGACLSPEYVKTCGGSPTTLKPFTTVAPPEGSVLFCLLLFAFIKHVIYLCM